MTVLALRDDTTVGFPFVLIEALACGLAPVAFECKNGPKQMMGDSELKKFLVEPFDVNNLADKLKTLMRDEFLREKMGNTAENISIRYQLETIMDKWNFVFNDLKN